MNMASKLWPGEIAPSGRRVQLSRITGNSAQDPFPAPGILNAMAI
jgi:hypothetical protein